jgi:hypothetical protein
MSSLSLWRHQLELGSIGIRTNTTFPLPYPGVELPNIQLRVQTNDLTISAYQNRGNGTQQPDYLRNEFSLGPLQRTVRLPGNVDLEKPTASQTASDMAEMVAPLKEKAAERQTSQGTS